MVRIILLTLIGLFIWNNSYPNVCMPSIFGNHMVMQQNSDVEIWGWAKPAEIVNVTGSWDNHTYKATPDNDGMWRINIKTPSAGGPYTLSIEATNKILIEDILIGEVWLGSGQSNMDWAANLGIDNAEEEIAKADYPEIRFFRIQRQSADSPQKDLEGQWVKCTPETFKKFSAVAFYFGRELHEKLNSPVGLIQSSWGGTQAQVWMPTEIIDNDEEFTRQAKIFNVDNKNPQGPGSVFNAMIFPIIPYTIAGVIWYQGESNVDKAESYSRLFGALITSWREKWGYEFPFYYAQIAPFAYANEYTGAALRDAQRLTLQIPKTGMVVTSDIGDISDIHPRNKMDVGKRLSMWALRDIYGFEDLIVSGPLFREMAIEKNKVTLFFDYASDGLVVDGKELLGFEIAGEDKIFHPAKAVVKGNTIIVDSNNVQVPKAVRFAFKNTAEPNLYNKAGLPASSFRTDDWAFE